MSKKSTQPAINLPYGLDKSNIAPSTLEQLSKQGNSLHKLVGRKRKNPFSRHKQEQEEKRRQAENETAEMMGDFINSFQGERNSYSEQRFIRSNNTNDSKNDYYQPKSRYTSNNERSNDRSYSPPYKKSKMRAIDELKEEIAKHQESTRNRTNHSQRSNYSREEPVSSTNLYVSNLNPITTEGELLSIFSKAGEVASVKIMKPYSEEERIRNNSRGFVCYYDRESAENAIDTLNRMVVHGNTIGVYWGRSVRPPTRRQPKTTFSSRDQHISIIHPLKDSQRDLITKLAEYVAKNGKTFEDTVLQREINNKDFSFLHDLKSSEHLYYLWRIHSFKLGGTCDKWSRIPFQFNGTGPFYLPPPMMNQDSNSSPDQLRKYSNVQSTEIIKSNHKLTAEQVQSINKTLRELTASRNDIMMAMGFLLRYTDKAQHVVDIIKEYITRSSGVSLSSKVACLYLISDILWNSSSVPKALLFRNMFKEHLLEIFKHLHDVFKLITGRISAKNANDRILKVIKAWRNWSLYSDDFLQKLELNFTPRREYVPQTIQIQQVSHSTMHHDNDIHNDESVDNEEEYIIETKSVILDDDIDGVAINDDDDIDGIEIDDNDIDGIAIDDDIDGIEIDDEDIDGIPIDDDIDDITI